jgi:uncharacterized protein
MEEDLLPYWGSTPSYMRVVSASASVSLFPRGGGIIKVVGEITTAYEGECVRCLSPLSGKREETVQGEFVPVRIYEEKERMILEEEFSQWEYEADILDLDAWLAEGVQILLPDYPLCSPYCKGLCSYCGGNRNLKECSCEKNESPFRSLLKTIRIE